MNISIIILAIINIVDSITSAAVTPTLTFYVSMLGGTKEQYGLVIMSVGSLASLFMMSVYGLWVDCVLSVFLLARNQANIYF